MREEFLSWMTTYPTEPRWRDGTFAGSSAAATVTTTVPRAIERALGRDADGYSVVGSAGKGDWTHTPWVAILDPSGASSVEEGIYVVYLLSKGCDRLYLTLNQGCTALKKSLGIAGARAELDLRSTSMRARLNTERLRDLKIDLSTKVWRANLYQHGSVVAAVYTRDAMPRDEDLRKDLTEALRLYREAVGNGGSRPSDAVVSSGSLDQEVPFELARLTRDLNALAEGRPIGGLQRLRAEQKGLRRLAGTQLFAAQPLSPDYAFHHGGRGELQFNVGVEEVQGADRFRHGVAFSFETSRALPDISVLIPKVARFNEFLVENYARFADFDMWHWRDGVRSATYRPAPLSQDLVADGTFVMLGRTCEIVAIDEDAILDDFDRLLMLYQYTEGKSDGDTSRFGATEFAPGFVERAAHARVQIPERELDVSLRHNLLQSALYRRLANEHGAENVRTELPTSSGMSVDVVLRHRDTSFWYYEIKTALSARACIRQALGQILEYGFWPGALEPSRLIICGEPMLDEDARIYLDCLTQRFKLPIAYESISTGTAMR